MKHKESCLYITKSGSEITFVATRTILISSDSLTLAEGGMASDGSNSVSSKTKTSKRAKEPRSGTTGSKLSRTEG